MFSARGCASSFFSTDGYAGRNDKSDFATPKAAGHNSIR
jgi:hypothetical protein